MFSLSIRGSRKPNNDAPKETVNSLVESGETLENVSAKNEYGQNQYSSKVFFVKDVDEKKPKKVIKVTFKEQHPDTWRKTVREGEIYRTIRDRASGWKEYLLPYREHGQKGSSFTYIVFDYLPGEDMIDRLRATPNAARRRLIVGALRALQFLARAGYLHGDVKPDNFWVTPEDDVRLFDLADAIREPSPRQIIHEIASVNTLIGTILERNSSKNRGRSRSRNTNKTRNRSRSRSPPRKEISTLEDLVAHYGSLIRTYEARRGGEKTRRSK